jgi:hypothetical protein
MPAKLFSNQKISELLHQLASVAEDIDEDRYIDNIIMYFDRSLQEWTAEVYVIEENP